MIGLKRKLQFVLTVLVCLQCSLPRVVWERADLEMLTNTVLLYSQRQQLKAPLYLLWVLQSLWAKFDASIASLKHKTIMKLKVSYFARGIMIVNIWGVTKCSPGGLSDSCQFHVAYSTGTFIIQKHFRHKVKQRGNKTTPPPFDSNFNFTQVL